MHTSSVIVDETLVVSEIVIKTINNTFSSIVEHLPNILAGIIVLILFWLISKVLKSLFWSFSSKTKLDYRLQLLFSRLVFFTVFVLGFFISLVVIVPSLKLSDLIAGLGFTSFIVGFATKDVLNNLLSGVLILWRQPFKIGDYVSVGSNQGRVEYIGIRVTQLRREDGEIILIPNGDMYSTALTIRNAGSERRESLRFIISYDTNISKAKEIAENAIYKVEGVSKENKPKVFVTEFSAEGVTITCFFWVRTEVHNPTKVFDECAIRIKEDLGSAGIKIFSK